jgi:Response regulator containing CheY-like receiver domain and AraC-type DNA-binding domain
VQRLGGDIIYNLLVVDDEELVRNAISTIIDWDSLGFTNIYEAEDGLEALELCRKQKIDLVLTDIVMPFMDGLELSAALKQEFPDIHVVILTGHEDFEYAKQSVDLGVKNYILKPVGASTLYTKMKEICKKLNIEASQKQYIAKMRSQIHQSVPILQEKFLYSLVCTQHGNRKNIKERMELLGLPLKSSSYVVGIVETDLSQTANADIELFLFTSKNISADCIGKSHCVFDDNNNHTILVFNLDDFEDDAHYIIYNTLQVIQKAIYSILKIDTTCAMGSIVSDLNDLYLSYHEAKTALDCRYSLGTNRVYDINDLDYIEKSFYYPFDEIKQLIYSIKFLGRTEIEQAIEEISRTLLYSKNLSSSNIKMVFIEMITSLLKELSSVKQGSTAVWDEGFALYNKLEHRTSLQQVLDSLLEFSIKVSEELHKLQSNSGQIMIQTVKEYIEQNFADDSISLSSAAEYTSVSTGYLSALFKKETGINFVEYLTDVRMARAMNLLKTTDKKTYEIAYETGFANPHYFSISFKKYTGMSPSDFRSVRQ